MPFSSNIKRLAAVTSIAAATLTGVLAGTASAASETVCNPYFCNVTQGNGTSVTTVDALRGDLILDTTGFFEVFLPDGTNRTGPTNAERRHRFQINRSFSSGLICLRYFERIRPGVFQEQGKAPCVSIPIG